MPWTARARAETLAERSVELHHQGNFDEADEALRRSVELVPSHHDSAAPLHKFERIEWQKGGASPDPDEGGITNLLNYSRECPRSDVSGQIFPSYYNMEVKGKLITGQRDPQDRLRLLPADLFLGKSVLDIGCNHGGMLLAIDGFEWAVGVDYDARLINAANRVAGTLRSPIRFYVFDLQREPVDLIGDFLLEPRVDIVLLLAVCPHIRNWREVIEFAAGISRTMVFEANGHEYEQLGQIRHLMRFYKNVKLLADRGAPGIGARRLLLCGEG